MHDPLYHIGYISVVYAIAQTCILPFMFITFSDYTELHNLIISTTISLIIGITTDIRNNTQI